MPSRLRLLPSPSSLVRTAFTSAAVSRFGAARAGTAAFFVFGGTVRGSVTQGRTMRCVAPPRCAASPRRASRLPIIGSNRGARTRHRRQLHAASGPHTRGGCAMALETFDTDAAFKKGIAAFRDDRWREGYELLTKVAQSAEKNSNMPGGFYSYLGLGIAHCE